MIYHTPPDVRVAANISRVLKQRIGSLLARTPAYLSRANRNSEYLHTFAGITVLAYVLLYVNLLTFLFPGAGHDDGLFMTHAYSIGSGHWLGPYSQFTLMKGPGYPIFLALLSLFRIPAPLAHAILWGSSAWLLSYATFKIFKSVFLSLFILEVCIWNFGPHSTRIIRDEITTPQILVVFSSLLLSLFVFKRSGMLRCALLSGLTFGWFWITREEGIVAVPLILILFGCAFQKAYASERSVRSPLIVFGVFACSFVTVLGLIAAVNYKYYRTFTIVDLNGSFKGALEALESVKPDTYTPYLSVSRNAREKIYRVSPTFAQLRPFIEDLNGPVSAWKVPSCSFYPNLCGDYAAGWFMWALRDAVAYDGAYSSAHASSVFYKRVHDEIERACNLGTLSCYHSVLPFMPHINESQALHARVSFKSAIDELSFVNPPLVGDVRSIGSDDQIRAAAEFLGVEIHTPPAAEPDLWVNHRIINFAVKQRRSLVRIYGKWMPRLLSAGLLSTLLVAAACIYKKSYSVGFAIACAAWVAVICRLIALTLIDISSFPAIFHMYIGYAYPFACYGSLLSIFLLSGLLADILRQVRSGLANSCIIVCVI